MTANIVFPVFNTGLAATGFLAVGFGFVAAVMATAKRAENPARRMLMAGETRTVKQGAWPATLACARAGRSD
jgi:hypothetical protein